LGLHLLHFQAGALLAQIKRQSQQPDNDRKDRERHNKIAAYHVVEQQQGVDHGIEDECVPHKLIISVLRRA
jgi:hypothetical protein